MYDNNSYFEEMKKMLNNEVQEARDGRNEAIMHYYDTYNKPKDPPIWTTIDILSFGKTVLLYKKLSEENRRLIACQYNFKSISILYNWFFVLTKLRNNCAHHLRVWNNTVSTSINNKIPIYKNLFNINSNNRLFNYLLILQVFLNKIRETDSMIKGLNKLISDHDVNVYYMGFPEDWEDRLRKVIDIENNNRKQQKI
jgi:abortive infection bacteriophage resistance protein